MRGAVGLTALFKDKRYRNDGKIIENDRELKLLNPGILE